MKHKDIIIEQLRYELASAYLFIEMVVGKEAVKRLKLEASIHQEEDEEEEYIPDANWLPN